MQDPVLVQRNKPRWPEKAPKRLKRIIQLCLAACHEPAIGIGKQEPLRFDYQGYWSRRINEEHRLVDAFDDAAVTVIQCR